MNQSDREDQLICIGCGSPLQSQDINKAGYVPPTALNKNEADLYCRRCFRLRHYNEVSDIELSDDDFLDMLHEISDSHAVVVNLVDLFDVNGTLISGMQRFAGNNPLIIVGNKADIIPKSVKKTHLKHWLTEQSHMVGLRPESVDVLSARRSEDIKSWLDKIEKIRAGRDIYVVGATNVGKSTLINQIINIATSEDRLITTSYFPGTTLGRIEIPLQGGGQLIDTPGIIKRSNLSHYLGSEELKYVVPKKPIKPSVYQLGSGQTLFFGGLARIDLLTSEDKQSIVGYFSNELPRHRTKTENADHYYETQIGKYLVPPKDKANEKLTQLTSQLFKIQEPCDIVISGLGWVNISSGSSQIKVWGPHGIDIYKREPMIG